MTTFHANTGRDVSLSDDHRTATGGYGYTTVFSSQPLQPRHKLTLTVVEAEPWVGTVCY